MTTENITPQKVTSLAHKIILPVIILAVIVLSFILTSPEQRTGIFWTSEIFLILSIVLTWISTMLPRSLFPMPTKFGIWNVNFFYIWSVLGLIICAALFTIQPKTYLLLHVLFLLIYTVTVAVFAWLAGHAAGLEKTANRNRMEITQLGIHIASALNNIEKAKLGDAASEAMEDIKKLADKIKYSDPMSSSSVTDVENEIGSAIDALESKTGQLTSDGENSEQIAAIIDCTASIIDMIEQRNTLLAASKQAG